MAKKKKYYIFLFFFCFINFNFMVEPGVLTGIKDTKLIKQRKIINKEEDEITIFLDFSADIRCLNEKKITIDPCIKNCFFFSFNGETIKIKINNKILKKTKVKIDFNDAIVDCNGNTIENISIKIN